MLTFLCMIPVSLKGATAEAAYTAMGGMVDLSSSGLASQDAIGSYATEEGILKGTMTNITKQTSNITNITKQRVKLNIKVLGVQLAGNNGQDSASGQGIVPEKQTFREQFTAPEMSIVSKLMTKVCLGCIC